MIRPLLVMGICGTGKSTIAAAVARETGRPFIEGDSFHPAENVAAMRAGQALTDDMRWGWLDAVAAAVIQADPPAVFACSALSHAHRDRLRATTGPLRIAYLHGDRNLIAQRIAGRQGHFMPASLIDSQLAALEPPDPDAESAIWIDVAETPERIVSCLLSALP